MQRSQLIESIKKGWIVDAYWEVYNKCNSANQAVLTGVSGPVSFFITE